MTAMQLRVDPTAKPSTRPGHVAFLERGHFAWHAIVDGNGALVDGCLVFVVDGTVTAEYLVYPGATPSAHLVVYARERRANVDPGGRRRLQLLSAAEAGRLVEARGYKSGHTLVCADIGPQLAALAAWWHPTLEGDGWRLVLDGLGGVTDGVKWKYRNSAKVTVRSVGTKAFASWGWAPTVPIPRTPMIPPRRGPIVDALNVADALIGGRPSTVASACDYFGLPGPNVDLTGVDRLRATTLALARLWPVLSAEVRRVAPGQHPARVSSTGGVASSILAATGLPALADRWALSDRFRGAAAGAFYGGRHAVGVTHVPLPAVLADISSTYPRVFSALGLGRHLVAGDVTEVEVTDEACELLASVDLAERLLDRGVWRRLGVTLVRVRPDGGCALPVRVGGRVAVTAVDLGGDDGWWHWQDIAASTVATGRQLDIVEAVHLAPGDAVGGLRPLRLPSGTSVDLVDDDLALASIAERYMVEGRFDLDDRERDRLVRLAKLAANVTFYGNLSRIDRVRVGPDVDDEVIGPDGARIRVRHGWQERPGPWACLAAAGSVTAGARLVLAMTMAAVEAAGGTWMHAAADSLLIAATHDGKPRSVACPGGPHKVRGRTSDYVRALPLATVEAILDRFDPLLCPTGGRAWKREAGWDRQLIGYVSGTNHFGLLDPGTGECEHLTEVGLGGALLDPTGHGGRRPDGSHAWAQDLHGGLIRSLVASTSRSNDLECLPPWALVRPALRTQRASKPFLLKRLQDRFPDRRLRPFVASVSTGDGGFGSHPPLVGLDVAAVDGWADGDWRHADGARAEVALDEDPSLDPDRPERVPVQPVSTHLRRWADLAWAAKHCGVTSPDPVRSRTAWSELIGKESDRITAASTGVGGARDLSVYRRADTWSPLRDEAAVIGAPRLAELTALPARTIRAVLSGRTPSPQTAEVVRQALARQRRRSADPDRVAACVCRRAGCGAPVTGRKLWCSPGCKKAAQRAAARLAAVPVQGGDGSWSMVCPAHGQVISTSPACPSCPSGKTARKPRAVVSHGCPHCGAIFGSANLNPCPVCHKERAAK